MASLIGVILIARPEALFGRHISNQDPTSDGMDPDEKGTSAQRLGAVGCVSSIAIRALGQAIDFEFVELHLSASSVQPARTPPYARLASAHTPCTR